MNFLKMMIVFFLLSFAHVNAFANFARHGTINLSSYNANGYLVHSIHSSLNIESGFELIDIFLVDTESNGYKAKLKLKPGIKNSIKFRSVYRKDDVVRAGYCTFEFTNVTTDKADFKVVDDSTLYGCGVENNFIGVNFA